MISSEKKLFDKLKPLEQQVFGIVKLRSQMRKDKNVQNWKMKGKVKREPLEDDVNTRQ